VVVLQNDSFQNCQYNVVASAANDLPAPLGILLDAYPSIDDAVSTLRALVVMLQWQDHFWDVWQI
jgi:hypothetical protein